MLCAAPLDVDTSSIMEWDLVLFPDDQAAGPGSWSVGKVGAISSEECSCQPLYFCEETGVWLESQRGLTTVRLSDIREVLEHDFAQRMSPDRISNPHGMELGVKHG
jgi:hypothetical protein